MLMFILLSLACWRISYALVEQDGPGDKIREFRNWTLQSKWSPLLCVYCTSVWVAAVMTALLVQPWWYLFSLSAGAILVHVIHERINE